MHLKQLHAASSDNNNNEKKPYIHLYAWTTSTIYSLLQHCERSGLVIPIL